jgi:hypothetical protein
MEAEHGEAVAGIVAAGVEDGVARLQVDGRQEDGLTASLAGSLNNGITVVLKLFAVQMAMGIYVIEN